MGKLNSYCRTFFSCPLLSYLYCSLSTNRKVRDIKVILLNLFCVLTIINISKGNRLRIIAISCKYHNMVIIRHFSSLCHSPHVGPKVSREYHIRFFLLLHLFYNLTISSSSIITIVYSSFAPESAYYRPYHVLFDLVVIIRISKIFLCFRCYRITIWIFTTSKAVNLNTACVKVLFGIIQSLFQ